MLLLGAGESGKSTLVKQMKIIHGHGYTNEELLSYRPTVCDNLVSSMMAVMKAMLKLRINLADQKNRTYVMAVLQAKQGGPLPATVRPPACLPVPRSCHACRVIHQEVRCYTLASKLG